MYKICLELRICTGIDCLNLDTKNWQYNNTQLCYSEVFILGIKQKPYKFYFRIHQNFKWRSLKNLSFTINIFNCIYNNFSCRTNFSSLKTNNCRKYLNSYQTTTWYMSDFFTLLTLALILWSKNLQVPVNT